MQYNPRELTGIIRHRRSIPPEQFDTTRKIDDEIIREMLDNANWAPNHGLTEPWRFVVFTGTGLKTLGDFQANMYLQLTPVGEFKQPKFDKLLQRPLLASHVIAIGMKRQVSGKIPEVEEIEATACAVQNMLLTAAAHNISGYWTTGGVTYQEEAKSFFSLEPADKLLGFLYLGYADRWTEGKRRPIDEKVKWVR